MTKATDHENETPCEEFSRVFGGMGRNFGINIDEWRDLWKKMHDEARAAGNPCPCGN